ncbi:metallopeptidase family protein [Alloscardovia omnicolens]|uniref:metallopeptidase family protein n=1 Tax=Alloscardovia omnicolens TaxID=419015 RepID=UPI003A6EAE81
MNELPWAQPTYRNRHGRGLRRPVFGTSIPHERTASGRFDTAVAVQMARLKRAWPNLFHRLECAVEDVPPSSPLAWEEYTVPLSQHFPARHGIPARIALYRKPIELRAHNRTDLQFIIRYEIVRQLAALYGLTPHSIDPSWPEE